MENEADRSQVLPMYTKIFPQVLEKSKRKNIRFLCCSLCFSEIWVNSTKRICTDFRMQKLKFVCKQLNVCINKIQYSSRYWFLELDTLKPYVKRVSFYLFRMKMVSTSTRLVVAVVYLITTIPGGQGKHLPPLYWFFDSGVEWLNDESLYEYPAVNRYSAWNQGL